MKLLLVAGITWTLLQGIVCPPVNQAKQKNVKEAEKETEDPAANVEYSRYLKEVIEALESDPEFVKKLEQANVTDIKSTGKKSGEIARNIELVNHNIRTKLNEIKRREVERLNEIKKALARKVHGLDPQMTKLVAHLEHGNPHTFEEEDLRRLIQQATKDLEEVDEKRHKEFKQYEMEKEHMKREKLKHMDEAHRKAEEERLKKLEEKHKDHPKLHHPGSKAQLEEVWERDDGMEKSDFNPKTFFALHDKDGNDYLDENEIEALFQSELDKMYNENSTEDDMIEREEEMNRMREHLFNEVDRNKDRLISKDEFMDSTKSKDFEKDEGWKGLDEQKPYTSEELEEFEKEYQNEEQHEGTPPPDHDLKFKPRVPPVPQPVHPQEDHEDLEHPGAHPGAVQHEEQAGQPSHQAGQPAHQDNQAGQPAHQEHQAGQPAQQEHQAGQPAHQANQQAPHHDQAAPAKPQPPHH